jgi:hypothetical protein
MVVKAQVSQDCQWRQLYAAKHEVLVGARYAFETFYAPDDGGHSFCERRVRAAACISECAFEC